MWWLIEKIFGKKDNNKRILYLLSKEKLSNKEEKELKSLTDNLKSVTVIGK